MHSNLRRSATALFVLTPAALLAACSTSDGMRSSRTPGESRTGYSQDSRAQHDGYYNSNADRNSDVTSRRSSSDRAAYYDPYGDGVGAMASINREFDLANSSANNPNWRSGPSRYDNDNPSHDNSSSQYNTGVTRNQSPGEGTVNNQNLAKGTVRPEGQSTAPGRQDDRQSRAWTQNGQQVPPRMENQGWAERNLSTRDMTTPDQQAAARDIADPATNPSNSNAQIGQQNEVSGRNQPYSTRSAEMNAAGQPQLALANATADAKILSLIHLKNQEEISLGRLASEKGSSEEVRAYGNMLVRDHTAADTKVMAVASRTGTTLLSDSETERMSRIERGEPSNAETHADDSIKNKQDPMTELKALNGADFDRAFASKMVVGHDKLVAAIEKAKPQVGDDQTRQLLNELLPTFRQHAQKARDLPGFTETASAR